MRSEGVKRPKRLWVATIMNIWAGCAAIGVSFFLLYSNKVPVEVRLELSDVAVNLVVSVALIAGSILALTGKTFGRYAMLVSAAVFYGIMATQNIMLLAALPSDADTRMYTSGFGTVVRSALSMVLTAWALFSEPSRRFFGSGIPSSVEPQGDVM